MQITHETEIDSGNVAETLTAIQQPSVTLPVVVHGEKDSLPSLSQSPSCLTASEREALEAAGVSDKEGLDAIEKESRRKGGKRSQKPEMRSEVALRIVENLHFFRDASDKLLWSTPDVGRILLENGLHRPVKGWNALGDTLGKHYLRLPHVTIGGRRYYDLGYVNADDAAKAARHEELNLMRPAVLKLLIAQPAFGETATVSLPHTVNL